MADKEHRILVVDDLADWRLTLSQLLKDEGYKVSATGSADKALHVLAGLDVDLAVLDIHLDETDEGKTAGIHLAAEIKRRWPHIKIVLITGYDTPDTIKQAFARDKTGRPLVDDYVPKTKTEDLIGIVSRVLKR